MKKIYFLLLGLTHLLAGNAQITDSLAYYLREGAMQRPQLKADFARYQAALQRMPQVSALPDPVLEMGFYLEPMELVGGKQVADFKLMQMFPWFGTRKAARNAAIQQANMAYAQFRQSRNNYLLQLKEAWYALVSLKAQHKWTAEQAVFLQQIETLRTVTYASGNLRSAMPKPNTAMTDLLRLKIERNEVENRLLQLDTRLRNQTADFEAALNRPIRLSLSIPDTLIATNLSVEPNEIANLARQQHPMLQRLTAEMENYRAQMDESRKRGLPMLGIGLAYSVVTPRQTEMTHSSMRGMDMIMPMVSVSIPLYRQKYQARIKENQLNLQAAIWQREQTVRNIEAQAFALEENLKQAQTDLQLAQSQIELMQQTLQLALTGYAAQTTSLSELLDLNRQLLSLRTRQIDAIARYNSIVARIENLIAQPSEEKENMQ